MLLFVELSIFDGINIIDKELKNYMILSMFDCTLT